jgi:hypothetical protein
MDFRPANRRRLWSLLDMLRPYGSLVAETLEVLRDLAAIGRPGAEGWPDADKSIRHFIKVRLPLMEGISEKIPIQSSMDQVCRIRDMLAKDTTGERLLAAFRELENRFTDDLKHVQFFSVRPDLAKMYGTADLLGNAVSQQFPSLIPEIEDIGSAFAFERWTASAFHSIRCLEAGIRAITRCLGIPDPTKGAERNWSNITRSIKASIDTKWPSATDKMTTDCKAFETIYGALAAMQNPYRNETMHLEARYNEGEARHILEMVRGLMQNIAARCDENGLPTV